MPFPVRQVLARLVDGSELTEFKSHYGVNLVTGWAHLHGFPIGILANDAGILFSEESQKAAQFIQLANRQEIPLPFVQNVTGYMVGERYEQGGMIKHGALMINGVANSTVPHLTLQIGGSYGAGNYGMCGPARASVPLRVAQCPDGGDGSRPARRGGVHGVAPSLRLEGSTTTRRRMPPGPRPSRPRSTTSRPPPTPAAASSTTG